MPREFTFPTTKREQVDRAMHIIGHTTFMTAILIAVHGTTESLIPKLEPLILVLLAFGMFVYATQTKDPIIIAASLTLMAWPAHIHVSTEVAWALTLFGGSFLVGGIQYAVDNGKPIALQLLVVAACIIGSAICTTYELALWIHLMYSGILFAIAGLSFLVREKT